MKMPIREKFNENKQKPEPEMLCNKTKSIKEVKEVLQYFPDNFTQQKKNNQKTAINDIQMQ